VYCFSGQIDKDKHSLVLTIYLHPAGSPMLSSKTSAKELNIHGLLISQSCKPKKLVNLYHDAIIVPFNPVIINKTEVL